jgi:hypothetical protein
MPKKLTKTRNRRPVERLVRICDHPHPYGVMGGALWCPTCGAIMFSTHATPIYMRSEWTLPTHDPEQQPKTVWHNDYVDPNALGQARWTTDPGIHKRRNPASPAG